MRDREIALLMSFYGLSAETAAEVIAEMRDLESLSSLAGSSRAARGGDNSRLNDLAG